MRSRAIGSLSYIIVTDEIQDGTRLDTAAQIAGGAGWRECWGLNLALPSLVAPEDCHHHEPLSREPSDGSVQRTWAELTVTRLV